MTTKSIVSIILVALATALPSYAFAIGERLSFVQSPDGSIVAVVSGAFESCSVALSTSTFAIAGSSITITTGTFRLGCPPPSPGTPLLTYSIPVNVGHLPDGAYSVSWIFNPPSPVLQPASGRFEVSNGALIDPLAVPALSPIGLVILAIFVVAAVGWQRRKAA